MNTYYSVSYTTDPWNNEHLVDFYLNKTTAENAANFIREAYSDALLGGIDVRVEPREGEIVKTEAGYRLKNGKNCNTVIKEKLNKDSYMQLLNLSFGDNLVIKNTKEEFLDPKAITEETFEALILSKDNTTTIVGYYKTKSVANKAFSYLACLNFGRGYTLSLNPYKGRLITSNSGKKWIITNKNPLEVKEKLDLAEYRRLTEVGETKPISRL